MPDSTTRVCSIKGTGGDVIVRLQASNALRAGADFILRTSAGAERDKWKMEAGDKGAADRSLTGSGITVSSLDHNTLTWQILVCSFVPAIQKGTVEVKVLQDGVACPMNKPARWELAQVPGCEGAEAVPIDASLEFKLV
jgi:hypothetical protein